MASLARMFPKASEEELDLMGRLMRFSPRDRLTAKQTLRHPSFRVTSNTTSAALSPSGDYAACGSANNAVYVWDCKTCEVVQTLSKHDAPVTACAWGTSTLASCDKSGGVIFWK